MGGLDVTYGMSHIHIDKLRLCSYSVRPVGRHIFLGHYLHRELWQKHIHGREAQEQLEELAWGSKARSAARGVLLAKYLTHLASSKCKAPACDNALEGARLDSSFYEAEYRLALENARMAQVRTMVMVSCS